MEIGGNCRTSVKWKSMEIDENLWESGLIDANLSKLIKVN